MKKTLAAIINHNARVYTDQLYDSLHPYRGDLYDIMVLDNGSSRPEEISRYTTHQSPINTYYGGALNLIFREFLSTDYDSLIVFNNDIILHGYRFIEILRTWTTGGTIAREMGIDYDIISPSVFQPERAQCTWKQMHQWGSITARQVRWVDFMCPFFKRHVVETIQQYDMELIYGWGQDIYTGILAEQYGWRMGVLDTLSVVHLSSQTYKDGRSDITASEYGQKAGMGMVNYLRRIGMEHKLTELRAYGETYRL